MSVGDGPGGGSEFDEEPLGGYRPPLPPEDRLWRHPSEVGVARTAPATAATRPAGVPTWPVVTAGLLGAVLALSVVALTGRLEPRVVERTSIEREALPRLVDNPVGGGVERIAAEVSPAVARLEIDGDTGATTGSGVVFRDSGYVLTNAHVVEGADVVTAVLADGREYDAEVVGVDEFTDIAVLKVDGAGLPVVVLGSARDLKVGEPAIAIGSPLGLRGGPSVTFGVVSALGRRLEARSDLALHGMIQTDAPIAPGSSGGALVDGRGAVIGITTAIGVSGVGAEGLGFAVPIDLARAVADDLIAVGRARHVWLGIEGADLDYGTSKAIEVPGGAVVHTVVPDSPAAEAGLVVDDVIVRVAGIDIASMSELVVALRDHDPGEQVPLEVVRGGARRTVTVPLAERR